MRNKQRSPIPEEVFLYALVIILALLPTLPPPAYAGQPQFPEVAFDRGMLARVVCYRGDYAWEINPRSNRTSTDMMCLEDHEKAHIKFMRLDYPNLCKKLGDGVIVQHDEAYAHDNECYAQWITINCFQHMGFVETAGRLRQQFNKDGCKYKRVKKIINRIKQNKGG